MLAPLSVRSQLSRRHLDMKAYRGFTLIELLVVIAIIGVLMALLFPAVGSAIDSARRASAKNDVTQIATAITAYDAEFGRLPSSNSSGEEITGDLLAAITGSNSRRIVFMETQSFKKGKGGLQNGKYVDPWGMPYFAALDTDYDNKILVSTNGDTALGPEIVKRVGVWNVNPNKKQQVRSWD